MKNESIYIMAFSRDFEEFVFNDKLEGCIMHNLRASMEIIKPYMDFKNVDGDRIFVNLYCECFDNNEQCTKIFRIRVVTSHKLTENQIKYLKSFEINKDGKLIDCPLDLYESPKILPVKNDDDDEIQVDVNKSEYEMNFEKTYIPIDSNKSEVTYQGLKEQMEDEDDD